MRFTTLVADLSVNDLRAIAKGSMQCSVTDMDFLETLAAHQCILVPPWIVRAQPNGGLARVTKLVYDADENVDKVRVLLNVAREFRKAEGRGIGFGGRFST